jgi:hypothetical protein
MARKFSSASVESPGSRQSVLDHVFQDCNGRNADEHRQRSGTATQRRPGETCRGGCRGEPHSLAGAC